jgi:hypothetical protein
MRAGDDVKPLLIGESPSRSGDRYHAFPLSGAVAQTLCQLAGIPPQAEGSRYGRWTWALYERFDCVNALKRYPSGGWDRDAAAARVGRLIEPERRVVVLLGRRAQTAYVDSLAPASSGMLAREYFEWVEDTTPDGARHAVALPHPSGMNRMLNDSSIRRRMGDVLRDAQAKAQMLEVLS